MVRLQNVTAKLVDRITSDEEERQRVGYEIRSTFRFATVNGEPDFRKAEVKIGDQHVATMAIRRCCYDLANQCRLAETASRK